MHDVAIYIYVRHPLLRMRGATRKRSVSTPFSSLLHPVKEGLVSVRFIESAKIATHRSLQTHAQLHNIFPMKIIIISLSCIDFCSGWQVCY